MGLLPERGCVVSGSAVLNGHEMIGRGEKELEDGAALPGSAFAMHVVRWGSSNARHEAFRALAGLVREGLPALLYIGNAWIPRHVTLVMPGNSGGVAGGLDVYDPATGAVTELDPERFAARTLGIAGWNVPWVTVQPRAN